MGSKTASILVHDRGAGFVDCRTIRESQETLVVPHGGRESSDVGGGGRE